MTAQLVVSSGLAIAGGFAAALAIASERRMHRHRQPGVTYARATLRRDGGWRRSDLFTPEGLGHQTRAARYGWLAAGCWVLALLAWVILGTSG